ncbi:helix-hairpin-helix domain-containing protein [Bacillus suaedaesalsae]|uniref:Helix-hairpin-helix domain-containing protein n=1 Tax=Bacillus suaedaesalsae TaxID=2810349 RepID=A0ABS2DMD9_9BACI|nr:helix-hairpin-helix domain-containing protein [Bacillus suaedaesalsae]MBM6619230.1 helix-hairpin-helix domain-containing protein [Bacillus suaedaesalsae]
MEYIRRYWLVLIPIAAFVIYVIFSMPSSSATEMQIDEFESSLINEAEEVNKSDVTKEPQLSAEIFVDVKGAVMKPGVYEVTNTSRVLEVIELAGGMTAEADQNGVNLAQKVTDEMVIYVPKFGETHSTIPTTTQGGDEYLININSATVEQLDSLPGIGPSKAEAIISFREENGKFKAVDDLVNVPGIGEKSLDSLREHITVQ